jgi:hypothetical protein
MPDQQELRKSNGLDVESAGEMINAQKAAAMGMDDGVASSVSDWSL